MQRIGAALSLNRPAYQLVWKEVTFLVAAGSRGLVGRRNHPALIELGSGVHVPRGVGLY